MKFLAFPSDHYVGLLLTKIKCYISTPETCDMVDSIYRLKSALGPLDQRCYRNAKYSIILAKHYMLLFEFRFVSLLVIN